MTFFSFFESLPIFNLDQKLLDLGAKSNVGFRLRRPVFEIQTLLSKKRAIKCVNHAITILLMIISSRI